MRRILILNGSLGGKTGNTAAAITKLVSLLSPSADVEVTHLIEIKNFDVLQTQIRNAHGFVFATGTYWDSWGSPLQIFLEKMTNLESSDAWIGKPAAALVTMHSVGGKEVLSRLQGVLSTFGLQLPPMSGMVYSFANQLALESEESTRDLGCDLWRLEDLNVIAKNLLHALESNNSPGWTSWPVDDGDPYRKWIRT